MKTEVSTKKLLEALLHSYIETNDLGNIYNGDGTKLITLDEAKSFIDGLKGGRCQMKIKNYIVIIEEVNRLQFEVEASSEAAAIDLVEVGEAGDPTDQRAMEFNCLSVKEYIK